MRRLSGSRAWAAVAVVAAIVAVLAVMLPGLGFGQITSSHGGPPSDVYTQTHPGDTCADADLNTTAKVMEQFFTLDVESNVVVYFSFELGFESPRQEGLISFGLDGIGTDQEWGIAAPGSITAQYFGTRQSGTLMWTFDHIAPGDHRVQAFARVSTGHAGMNGCALTVFVIPVAD